MKIPYKSLILLCLALLSNPVYSAQRSKQRHRTAVSQQNSAVIINKPAKTKKLSKKERRKLARARTNPTTPGKFFSALSGGVIGYLFGGIVTLVGVVTIGVYCTSSVPLLLLSFGGIFGLIPCLAGAYIGAKLGSGAYDAICSRHQSV